MRADVYSAPPPPPPRGKGVDVSLTLVRTRACERFVWITSLRSCLPLFDPRLHLALPAGGGGARAATLALCAHLWSSDGDGSGPLRCSGSDLDLLGMKDLKAAERAFASLNFSTTVSTRVPKSSEGENRSIEQKALLFLPDICQVHPQMSLRYHHGRHRPAHSSGGLLVARRAKSVVRRSSATSSGDKPWPLSRSFSRSAW